MDDNQILSRVFDMVAESSMMGFEYDFFGIDNLRFCLGLPKRNRVVFEAIENLDDGYRSYLGAIEVETTSKVGIFFSTPIARVRVMDWADVCKMMPNAAIQARRFRSTEIDGWALVDVDDNHIWLIVGTDNSDNYYPMFVFDYDPKAPK